MESRTIEFGSTWARDHFVEFCRSELLGPVVDARVVARVDRAAEFFLRVARRFADPASIDENALRSAFGIEGLRRAEKPATFLRRSLSLAWHPVPVVVTSVEAALPAAGIPALRVAYARHLRSRLADESLAPRTVRAYRHAGDALLELAERAHCQEPTARHVRQLLWARPGLRASLGCFLSWLASQGGISVGMPHRAPRDLKQAELRLIGSVSSALSTIRSSPAAPRRRAMVAFLTSKLLTMPIERVLALKWSDVRCGDVVRVAFGEEVVELPSALGALFVAGRRDAARFVFEGRTGWSPLSAGAVRHHVEATTKRGTMSGREGAAGAPPSD